MNVTGNTAIYGLIGDPIAHVRAPEVLNAHFSAQGIDAFVTPIHATEDSLAPVVTGLRCWNNLVGIGVTIPHKEQMTQLVDELSDAATRCGATNVVRRSSDGQLTGTQIDGTGFGESLAAAGFTPHEATVLLIGAGGTARAIAFDLATRGIARLIILNRTPRRAKALAEDFSRHFPHIHVSTTDRHLSHDADLVINATSLGLGNDDALPLPPSCLDPSTWVADVVMHPRETAFLAAARNHGCPIHPGHLMLEAQVHATVEFLGLRP